MLFNKTPDQYQSEGTICTGIGWLYLYEASLNGPPFHVSWYVPFTTSLYESPEFITIGVVYANGASTLIVKASTNIETSWVSTPQAHKESLEFTLTEILSDSHNNESLIKAVYVPAGTFKTVSFTNTESKKRL